MPELRLCDCEVCDESGERVCLPFPVEAARYANSRRASRATAVLAPEGDGDGVCATWEPAPAQDDEELVFHLPDPDDHPWRAA